MPRFDTPTPIDLAIHLPVGEITVVASDRTDTIVTVSPTNESKAVDRRGAEETKVDFDGQRLTVTAPKPRFSLIGTTESVDLLVELPTASRLTAEISVGGVRTTGRLGATRIKASTGAVDLEATGDLWLRAGHGNTTVGTATGGADVTADHGQIRIGSLSGDAVLKSSHGNIRVGESTGELEAKLSYGDLEATGDLWLRAGHGNTTVGTTTGGADITADHGQIRIGTLGGDAVLKSSHGNIRVGESTGELEAKLSYGDLEIDKALGSVTAKTAYGAIELPEVSSGSIQVESGFGQITIGIRPGVRAWLDVASRDGRVRNDLESDSAPDSSEQTVAVRARTQFGNITLHRAR